MEHLSNTESRPTEGFREPVLDEINTARSFADLPVHVGVLPGHPHIRDQATLTGIVDAVADAGVERISFYNYGLLPRPNLEWIAAATAPYR